jgi:hypothetical protein
LAQCPAHHGKDRNMKIAAGKTWTVIFECMSQHCDHASILKSMGLTWADISHGSVNTPEIRQRMRDQERLKKIELYLGAFILNKVMHPEDRYYWMSQEMHAEQEIFKLRRKLGTI